jgi:hypothetical protein
VDVSNCDRQPTIQGPLLRNSFLHAEYVNRVTKLKWKSKANKCYSSGDFRAAKMLLDTSCLQLKEGNNHEAIGLKCYLGFVMPHSKYPGMDDSNQTN